MTDFKTWVDANMQVVAREGDEYTVVCPFHGGGSMRVNVAKGVFYCHGCGTRGNHRVLTKTVGGDIAVLNRADHVMDTLAALKSGPEEVRVYPESWLNQFTMGPVHPYWAERGVLPETVAKFRGGYDPEYNAITIPIRDSHDRPIGVIRRHVDQTVKPKVRYPAGFRLKNHLWNLHNVEEGVDTIVVVEGALDAILMEQAGFHAVALLGSRISERAARSLRRTEARTVVVCSDDDDAGWKAVVDSWQLADRMQVLVGMYEDGWGGDPGSLTDEQRRALVAAAVPLRSVCPPEEAADVLAKAAVRHAHSKGIRGPRQRA